MGKVDAVCFETDLHNSITSLDGGHDTRKLTAIMASNQDAAFPDEHISEKLKWKGGSSAQAVGALMSSSENEGRTPAKLAQNAVYLAIQEQFKYWKHKWQWNGAEEQSVDGQSTFNFHLMSTLAVAMDTYWFEDGQQVQLFDWLRDIVSGAEMEPLQLGNEKLTIEVSSTKKKIALMEEQLETMMKNPQGSNSSAVNLPAMVCIVLLAVALGHILTLHTLSK